MGCDIETQARASATVITMEVCGEKRRQFYITSMILESCAHTRAQTPLCLAACRCSEAYASLAVEKKQKASCFASGCWRCGALGKHCSWWDDELPVDVRSHVLLQQGLELAVLTSQFLDALHGTFATHQHLFVLCKTVFERSPHSVVQLWVNLAVVCVIDVVVVVV
jgi:hypothetical protein